MKWLVCAYYTKDDIYTKHAANLIESMKKFKIPYEVTPIDPFPTNDWDKGTHYKAIFLQDMLRRYSGRSIVYVDVDAIFLQYPDLFDILCNEKPEVNIAVHVLDHTKYRRKTTPPELLSGTIYLRNTEETSIIIQEWMLFLGKNPKLWDQNALKKVLENHSFYNLPDEYCTIFDYMSSVKNPVIKHFQASREAKNRRKIQQPRLRQVQNGIVVKLSRIKK